MGRRENFIKTMNHQKPDRLILDLGGNPLSGMEGCSMERLLDYFGFSPQTPFNQPLFGRVRRIDPRILEELDIDTRSVGAILTPLDSSHEILNGTEYIDEWGIRRKFTGMYWDIVENPLRGSTLKDLDHYRWPVAESIESGQISQMAQEARKIYTETDFVLCAEHPVYGIFELGCWLCGFDDFLMKMALEPHYVEKLFDIILSYQKKVIEIYYGALGEYIHYTSSGDDFATQNNLFMSPDLFAELIKPYLKERIRFTKKYTQAAYLHHSCGSVYSIIDDLIDCGVDILNPIQPLARSMHPLAIKECFGERIVFHGGIDTQSILPYGTTESIQSAVRDTIRIMNDSGGYIFAAAHNIQEDVPPENLVCMFRTAREIQR
jgi:uroporphyrinogen decarboxylase